MIEWAKNVKTVLVRIRYPDGTCTEHACAVGDGGQVELPVQDVTITGLDVWIDGRWESAFTAEVGV